jgi:hypothetical protein
MRGACAACLRTPRYPYVHACHRTSPFPSRVVFNSHSKLPHTATMPLLQEMG